MLCCHCLCICGGNDRAMKNGHHGEETFVCVFLIRQLPLFSGNQKKPSIAWVVCGQGKENGCKGGWTCKNVHCPNHRACKHGMHYFQKDFTQICLLFINTHIFQRIK